MSTTLFKNPYQDVPEENTRRLNADILAEDYNFIRRLKIDKGTIQTTINILWKGLIDALRQRNIIDFSSEREFEEFMSNIRIIDARDTSGGDVGRPTLGGGTPDDTVKEGGDQTPHDRRGTAGTRHEATGSKDIFTDVQGGPKRKRGGGPKQKAA